MGNQRQRIQENGSSRGDDKIVDGGTDDRS